MATLLQEDLAEAIVKNQSLPKYKRKNKKDLLVSVGYAPNTASVKAKEIIESKGVQETLSKSGLTKELITEALVYDIEQKPKRRIKELELGAAILGMTEHERGGDRTLIINITGETASRYGIFPEQKRV